MWPSLHSPWYDVGSRYTVPYTIYTTGIGWRADKLPGFNPATLPNPWAALVTGLVAGVFFGLITSAVPYAMARGTRDFSSTMQLVAGRYDVLCDPQNAEKARDLLARLAI